MLPLGKLGDDKITVILYDQLGCGLSDKPNDAERFTVDYLVQEVDGIREALGLGKVNLLGVSWGGALALQYALNYPQNLRRLVISSGFASTPELVAEMKRLKRLLPREVQDTLAKYEALWAYNHPDYLKAVDVFYHEYLCRLPKWPEEVTKAGDYSSIPVYYTMNGPNEFTINGNLRDCDIRNRLSEIKVPTLVTVGRYDEVPPKIAETIHQGIQGSQLVLFEKSAHLALWEEPAKYEQTIRDFVLSDD
jgi:proline iminopeptidase